MPRVHRALRLLRPGPRLRLIRSYVTISALALLLQYVLFSQVLTQVARSLPSDGELMLAQADRLLLTLLVGSFVVLLPITFLVGVAVSSRWAGPLARMERYLRELARGETDAELELRHGDELRELTRLLRHVTAPLRAAEPSEAEPLPDERARRRAA
jgi:signal transduction histidine kinase